MVVGADNQGALNFFGVTAEDFPAIAIHSQQPEGKFIKKAVTVADVSGFVNDYKTGKVRGILGGVIQSAGAMWPEPLARGGALTRGIRVFCDAYAYFFPYASLFLSLFLSLCLFLSLYLCRSFLHKFSIHLVSKFLNGIQSAKVKAGMPSAQTIKAPSLLHKPVK